MWIWIVSLVVLVACIIFTYWMIVSSYEYLPADKKLFSRFLGRRTRKKRIDEQTNDFGGHVKKIDTLLTTQATQITRLQQRIDEIEKGRSSYIASGELTTSSADEENWKELYYEENEVKEKLENQLDEVCQQLEEARAQINETQSGGEKMAALQSEYDARLNDIISLQQQLDQSRKNTVAARARIDEVEAELRNAIAQIEKLNQLESANKHLRSENETMRAHLKELTRREEELQDRLAHARELESRVALFEQEKTNLVNELEKRLGENRMFYSGQ